MANQRLRALSWRSKWTKTDWVVAGVGLAFIVFVISLFSDSDSQPMLATTATIASDLVELTLLRSAEARGAYCLDGSLPGYHFKKGFGSGSRSWVLHIEGGGWCGTLESCNFRKMTPLGSSNFMERQVLFKGLLSSDPSQNPDFFNWNKVKIRYCDGASFAGNPESESKNGTGLFFRGKLIWETLMDHLLSIGLSKAKQAILSGCSAGGLATYIHCDDFRNRMPKDAKVKCLADAGFFLDVPDVSRNPTMISFYHDVVNLHGVAKSLNRNCIAKMEPSKCMFPREIIKRIKTPLFIVNPAYDFWQIQNVLVPDVSDPHDYWRKCKLNIQKCDKNQMEILQGFRESLLKAVEGFRRNKEGGMFINSCFVHCQTWITNTWHSTIAPRINNKTIAESVGDWFFSREVAKHIDCPYPCNPTCINMDFTQQF